MTMTAREERGLVIAATQKLMQKGKVWLVPSQNGKGKYTVCPDHDTPFCSCPDHEDTGLPCKHVFAVRTVMAREHRPDGTVTETREVVFSEKKTYKQDWPLYNLAQIEEKRRFLVLLHDLCRGLPNIPQPGTGRRWTPMADIVFTCALKVYTGLSSRRFGTDLDDAHSKGYLSRKLHPVMVCAFLESESLTPVLQDLIVKSSLPLRSVETVFSPDSTGFSTSRFVRWFDEKYGTNRSGREWVKCHAICGVKTHIVTAVEILDKNAGDCPQFGPLVTKTAENFNVQEVPADRAYLSRENLELVHKLGATPFIPFKTTSTPGEAGSLWEKMFHYYNLNKSEFERHYHQRSNVESAFSMIKAKFRDSVRSKTNTAMKNECLVKFICHNICVLILSQLELGIDVDFWGDAPASEINKEIEQEPVTLTPVTVKVENSIEQNIQVEKRYQMCAGA
jgi:transposase